MSDTRVELVDAALRVIGEHGIAGLTNRRVAQSAGVSLGSLTYHFACQTDLLSECLSIFVRRETARITALAGEVRPRIHNLADAAAAVEEALESMVFGATDVAVLEVYLHAARQPDLQPATSRCWAAYDEVAITMLRAIGAEAPEAMAPQVVALIAGMQLRRMATGERSVGGLGAGLSRLTGDQGDAATR